MFQHTMSRRTFIAAAGGLAALGLAGCGGTGAQSGSVATTKATDTAETASTTKATPTLVTTAEGDYATGTHHAQIEVADYGTIKVELYATNAPVTVANFAKLANEGFYDGLTFHRIIKGFMIQGGDPNGDGTGGSGTNIIGEFSANGHPNPILHERGTISMARSSAPNSASSQFFIMQEASTNLDGQYAAFGKVTEGIEVVDAICDKVTPTDSNGTVPADQQPKITSIKMID